MAGSYLNEYDISGLTQQLNVFIDEKIAEETTNRINELLEVSIWPDKDEFKIRIHHGEDDLDFKDFPLNDLIMEMLIGFDHPDERKAIVLVFEKLKDKFKELDKETPSRKF